MQLCLATWLKPGQVAIEGAKQTLEQGGSMLDALEHGLAKAEDDPELIAIGRGSVPNTDGELELDAAIMEGDKLQSGAVCSLRGILPAISVARLVMDKTPHMMLSGEQARRFAIEQGFKPQNLMTTDAIQRYEKYLEDQRLADKYVHTIDDDAHDTITMLGIEDGKRAIAASSTSGLPFKMPGRVGDSPIVGAGIYADSQIGCAGSTGWGEELWRAVSAFRTVQAISSGATPEDACKYTIEHMLERQPESRERQCVVLAANLNGEFGAACTKGRFDLWILKDGHIESRTYMGMAG